MWGRSSIGRAGCFIPLVVAKSSQRPQPKLGTRASRVLVSAEERVITTRLLTKPASKDTRVPTIRRQLWQRENNLTKSAFNEPTSKRRKGYPSETHVKRGRRIVGGEKELIEKLGRNDLCPCDSGRRFQELLPEQQTVRWLAARPLLLENEDKKFVAFADQVLRLRRPMCGKSMTCREA